MNFEELQKDIDLPFLKIHEISTEDLIFIDCELDDIVSTIHAISPQVILYSGKTHNEKLRELIPESAETKDTISFLNFLMKMCITGLNCCKPGTEEYIEFGDLCSQLEVLSTLDREKGIAEYQLYVPFNGKFFTFGVMSNKWVKHEEFIKAKSINFKA